MPLLDHFHAPLSERRPWESFHATWASTIADGLNETVLPPGLIALEHIHAGPAVEIDVATWDLSEGGNGTTATATRTVWTPATAPTLMPALFPPSATVEIHSTDGGRTLVAAIELVSPGNKDRPDQCRLFAAKCATYLSRGIGLIVVDVVTTRRANLHNELVGLLTLPHEFQLPDNYGIHAVAYRPLHANGAGRIETWPFALSIGELLPTVPLSLAADHCVPVSLETSYAAACQRRRVHEAMA